MDEGQDACAGRVQCGTWAKRGRTRTRRFLTLLRGQSQRPRDAGGSTQKRCDPPQSRGLGPLGRFYLDGVTPLGDLPRAAAARWPPPPGGARRWDVGSRFSPAARGKVSARGQQACYPLDMRCIEQNHSHYVQTVTNVRACRPQQALKRKRD